MTIHEILVAHTSQGAVRMAGRTWIKCACDATFAGADTTDAGISHRSHLAEVLEKHMQEREAAVIAGLAELLDEYRSSHDVAECAGYVDGETGRQAVIDKWESITEEPAEWLREQSKLHHERGFDYLIQIAYDAWYAGKESDPNEENPYADEDGS
ncbi:hypothetical protein [Glutamicibacter sp. AOP3-A1-12]|uniref:hypothetical protein n=1 Tax=Glutamicibacter sp. AOP3-A1-12 TaxID=3457701 RepID=UPI004033CAE6